jgi:hypothetical protein
MSIPQSSISSFSAFVWFQLLDSATGQPYKNTFITSVLRSSVVVPVIEEFQKSVKDNDKDGEAATGPQSV